jgi:farnesyl-diphosphate farnesyltransferase
LYIRVCNNSDVIMCLQGLDTVEDDMTAFLGRLGEKLTHLRNFDQYLYDPYFRMTGVGEGDEATLLRHFYHVNCAFASLPKVDQDVIADICAKMGDGMAQYCGRDLREGTTDIEDYNMYCHYVAGLVGEGLSRLFVAHGDEEKIVADDV